MHVVDHTFRLCRRAGSGDHLTRQIAQGDVMTELRQPDGRLPLSAAGIEDAQRPWTKGRQQCVKILPQDRLA